MSTTGGLNKEVLERARGGCEESLQSLLEECYSLAFKVAYRYVGNKADAEDVAQNALLKIARSLKNFRGDSKIETWVYRITINCGTDYIRKQQKRRQTLEGLAETSSSVDAYQADETSQKILEALGALKEKERQAIILVYFEGLTHKEVANTLQCAETTISWRIFSAKKKLKNLLGE